MVGGTTDNCPYSYPDENQQLTGFAVEVFDAVARQMHIRSQRVLGPGSEIADRFDVSVRELMTWNRLRQSSSLRAGQRLVVYTDPSRQTGG